MNWTGAALVLSARPVGEGKAFISVLSEEHGKHRGVVPGGASSRKKHLLQQGNCVIATWRARTPDQIGTLTCEPQVGIGVHVLCDKLRLAALASACALLDAALAEREPSPAVYAATRVFLAGLDAGADCRTTYLKWEVSLLALLGYGLEQEVVGSYLGEGRRSHTVTDELTACLDRLRQTVFQGETIPFARMRFSQLCRTHAASK